MIKRLQIVIFIVAILLLAIFATAGKGDRKQWEYARILHQPFTDWVWSGPEGTIQTEEIEDIFRKLGIRVQHGESASIYTLFKWAGSQGWELVSLEQNQTLITGWFKRETGSESRE